MSKQFDSFVGAVEKAVTPKEAPLSAEFLTAARQVGEKVEKWGCEHGLMTAKKLPRGGQFFAANDEFPVKEIETALGPQAVADLLADCGISKQYEVAAAKKVAAILCQALGSTGDIAFADYNSNDADLQGDIISLESLYGADLWAAVQPGTEAFGIQMDRVIPDLKTILTVSILQFHTALTHRMVQIQSVTQSNVQVTREMMDIFDMSKPDQKPVRAIDLYRDPSMVTVRATRIEPRMANDADGKWLVADGIYKFEEDLSLWDLALDPSRPGYDKFNHTDIVEDMITVDGVLVELSKTTPAKGEGGTATTTSEQFMIPLDEMRSRLTQVPNDLRSTIRRLTLDRTSLLLNAGSAVYGSTSESTLLTDFTLASGKSLKIKLNLTAQVDRKTAKASASAWGKLAIHSIDESYVATEADKALLGTLSVKFVGFTLNARYNEDNKRKTSIRAEINRRNQSYELPSGRNFVIDFAIGQEGAVNAAARLAQLEHIGRDGNNLRIVTETLQRVHDQRLSLGNGAAANAEIASPYAAGDTVHQIAYIDTIDYATGFLAVRSSDASGDLKEFTRRRLNKIMTGLIAGSLLPQQLAEGTQITFRAVTSPFVLGAILSLHHIHAHLDNLDQRGSGNVEFVMNLDCGVKLEFVTTTFSSMNNRIVIVPFFESAPTSVLNFGTDFDQGTLVGAITLGADNSAAHNRMFSTTREALIPTNVVGAVVEIVGLGDARIGLDFPGIVDQAAESSDGE